MSQADSPTLKAIFNKGFALSQAVSKKISSSEPLPHSRMSVFSSNPDLTTDVATPRSKRTKHSGPATQLLHDLFEELDETESAESIEDSIYVDIQHARQRAGTLGNGPRPRIETSFKTKSFDLPRRSSNSSDHFMDSLIDNSHLNESYDEKDLQKLSDKIGEIQSRNKQIIEADDDTILNTLPAKNTGYFSRYAKVRGSVKAYKQEFEDILKKEKKIYESTPAFINRQMSGLSAAEMRKRIPKLILAQPEYEFDEEDDEEKSAIQILEDLFKELAERDASTNEGELENAEQIIEKVENKGKDNRKEQVFTTGNTEDRQSEKGHSPSHDLYKSREINIFADLAEQTDGEIRQYSAITQQYIADGCQIVGLDQILEKHEEQLVQSQQRNEIEPEVTPTPELEEKNKEESTESQQDICEVSSVMKSPTVDEKDTAQQRQHDVDGNTKEAEEAQNSSQNHDTLETQNLDVIKTVDLVTSASVNEISDSTSSIDENAPEEEDEMQCGMAAMATGVMVAALWMIERKTGAV
ncbi:hypothetical protein BOTCAL_0500g00020 [Botryotinia calthae]|uniref:Uncharacterized protein n=1 Tax=Botryotinia calthae TaxID=38488 RepID=A0A4Y8CNM9_9HELO|nr:hypothetical protein BOTCAL_0500g00020 [Botryotinia calthae]